jgi:hypothetical protein
LQFYSETLDDNYWPKNIAVECGKNLSHDQYRFAVSANTTPEVKQDAPVAPAEKSEPKRVDVLAKA